MDNVGPAELLEDALGGLTPDDRTILDRALSLLGITVTRGNKVADCELSVSFHSKGQAVRSISEATFDVRTRRWRFVNPYMGTVEPTRQNVEDSHLSTKHTSANGQQQQTEQGLSALVAHPDWTDLLPHTRHAQFVRDTDWKSTSLGPMLGWPTSLRLMTLKIFADPRSACLYWGPDRVAIYNEPFATLANSRHPYMMGATARDAMPATWPFLSQMFNEVERSGVAFSTPLFEMAVEKTSGFVEEAWYDGVFLPLRTDSGAIEGFYNSGFEITDHEMAQRRLRLLHQLSATPNFNTTSTWQHIIDACEPFDRDITMLAVYSASEDLNVQSQKCSLQLEGALGIKVGHQAIPKSIEIHDGSHGFIPAFRAAKATGVSVLLDMPGGALPDFLDSDVQWRGFHDPATHIAVVPLVVTGIIAGFLVVGLNPRRPYDESHKQFVRDIGLTSSSVLASSFSFEQAQAREAQLSKELTAKEKFITKLAEVATVGIFNLSAEGAVTWANSKFYNIMGMPSEPETAYNFSFLTYVPEEEEPKARAAFEEALQQPNASIIDIRLKRKWIPPGSAAEESCWILSSFLADIDDGKVKGVLGCITDISHLKWAEQLQRNTAEAAKEAKLQQERFIDMTSHEMRNPLSAIMQCADGITSSVERSKLLQPADDDLNEALESMQDNAQTIAFCAGHQKRIIDDILAVSKLDSRMLAITPVLTDPLFVLKQVMQVFEAELSAADITSSYSSTPSYQELGISWVHCDPSRLTQILINLVTNSIKFTKTAEKREIHVITGALTSPPSENVGDLKWFPSGRTSSDFLSDPGSRIADNVYLSFAVSDTGKGISADEMSLLFNRFSQANPRTHVQYGGSGLGLFISRELTELQGGMIGASSTPGQGSTFAFYIKARKASESELASISSSSLRGADAARRPSSSTLVPNSVPRRPSATMSLPLHDRKTSVSASAAPEILLVEDNLINQKVLGKQLRKLGCTVYIANHGAEALEFLKSTRHWKPNTGAGPSVGIILMDWEMPVMDGLTCTKQIRELESQGQLTERLPVIATTANARAEQVQLAYDAGFDDVLAKPFKVDALMDRIRKLV